MDVFQPIKRNPGDPIRSEDWNKMQEDIKVDLERLAQENRQLREYIDKMAMSVTFINLDSPVGSSYRLDEDVPGEVGNYATSVLGYITRQFVLGRDRTGEICRFGILDRFDVLHYWSGAGNGDKPTLEIALEYVDGTIHTQSNLLIHEWVELRAKGTSNPYVEYLLSPNERVWYKYRLVNPNPDKEVRLVSFRNTNKECIPRIANVVQHTARIRPIEL